MQLGNIQIEIHDNGFVVKSSIKPKKDGLVSIQRGSELCMSRETLLDKIIEAIDALENHQPQESV